MFAALVEYARSNGFRQIRCEFIPTAKNVVVRQLFETLGCEPDGEARGSLFYRWSTDHPIKMPGILQCSDRTQTASVTAAGEKQSS
jgi:predicted enzyme involved in methoxymalonyl-ACP biosynthesis